MVQSGAAEPEHRTPPAPLRPRRRAEADPVAAEVDRVLDKISEQGIEQPHGRRAPLPRRSRREAEADSSRVDTRSSHGPSALRASRLAILHLRYAFVLCAVLINLLPDFLAVLDAGDREAAYRQYRESHRPILDAYWRNYVLDPDSPHAGEIITAALRADRSDLLTLADSVNLVQLAEEAIARAEDILQVDRPTDTYLMVGPRRRERRRAGRGRPRRRVHLPGALHRTSQPRDLRHGPPARPDPALDRARAGAHRALHVAHAAGATCAGW